jgi:beta-glucosidase
LRDVALVRAAVRANAATVVVLVAGSAVCLGAVRDEAPALLMAWYPGMEGGHALAEVLLGRQEPGGRLPFAWPDDESRLISWWSTTTERVTYGPLHGQRLNEARRWEVAYPLSFGRSYTRFSKTLVECIRRPSEGAIDVIVAVTNEGARRGRELVAIRGACDGEPSRLVGFARCELEAGGRTHVAVRLDARSMARWEPGRGWRSPAGAVRLFVANDFGAGVLTTSWIDG